MIYHIFKDFIKSEYDLGTSKWKSAEISSRPTTSIDE